MAIDGEGVPSHRVVVFTVVIAGAGAIPLAMTSQSPQFNRMLRIGQDLQVRHDLICLGVEFRSRVVLGNGCNRRSGFH